MKTFNKAYKYRFYPNNEQKEFLTKTFGSVRFVWNNILDWRSKEYTTNKVKISYADSSKKLTALKNQFNWLNEVSSVALQQTLRDQDRAFSNFFAKKSQYPVFKKRQSHQSFRLVSTGFTYKDGNVFIAKSKTPLNIRWSRNFNGIPSSITITKDSADRYFISILVEETIEPKSVLTKTVGIDVGLSDFAISSDGVKYKPLKAFAKYSLKLTKLQKKMLKKKHSRYKGDPTPKSKNFVKASKKVARVQAKIADCRNDFLHKLSTKLINENQVICLENLNIQGLIRNKKLSKHIADASWSKFINQLEYKAMWYGRTISFVSPFFPSSQICSKCGTNTGKKPLHIRKWKCNNCNTTHDRDVNAANNILTAGLAELACGDATVGGM